MQQQNTHMPNPLMHMINQMQQANKLPAQPSMVEKPPNSVQTQHLDPIQQLVQQMGGLQPNLGPTVPVMPQQNANLDPTNQTNDNDPIKSLLRQLANKSQVFLLYFIMFKLRFIQYIQLLIL